MRIAYVTTYDARDARSWSGTGFHIARSLERLGCRIEYVGPLRKRKSPLNVWRHLMARHVSGLNDLPGRDPGVLQHYAEQVAQRLRRQEVDAVLSPGSLPIAHLRTTKPVVMWSDATFRNVMDYYPEFSRLTPRAIRNAEEAERRAIANCSLAVFSSEWAVRSAVRDYGADPGRVAEVPFGANLEEPPQADAVDAIIGKRLASLGEAIRFLAVGVDWHRKGFDVATEVVREVRRLGHRAELVVAGAKPPDGGVPPDFVRLVGRFDKTVPADALALQELFAGAHCFILPTRADCTPVVLSEAAAFALPAFVTDTGGVGSVVRDGVNGHVFGLARSPKEWASRISRLFSEPGAYERIARSSFSEYQRRLNWDVAGRCVLSRIARLLG